MITCQDIWTVQAVRLQGPKSWSNVIAHDPQVLSACVSDNCHCEQGLLHCNLICPEVSSRCCVWPVYRLHQAQNNKNHWQGCGLVCKTLSRTGRRLDDERMSLWIRGRVWEDVPANKM